MAASLAPCPEDLYDTATIAGFRSAGYWRMQVQLPNWNEYIVTHVALARIGAVLVPTMPIYQHDEVRYILQHSGSKVAVVAGEFRGFDAPAWPWGSSRRSSCHR